MGHERLGWLGPYLRHPRLWHLGRRTVALGSAIGICFGILVPIGQIPLAAMAAIACRANLPTAILATFITNGFTYLPIYALAYWLGCVLTGGQALSLPLDLGSIAGLGDTVARVWRTPQPWISLGLPLAVGIVVLSVIAAVVTYVVVLGSLSLRVRRAWTRRGTRNT